MRRPRRLLAIVLLALAPALSFADIEDQRARLPPPAEACPDPVEGTWVSLDFYPQIPGWMTFTFEARRDESDRARLAVSAMSEHWGPSREPPTAPCGPDDFRRRKHATGAGTTDGRSLSFTLTALGDEVVVCGTPLGDNYELATWTGTLDLAREEYLAVLDAPSWRRVPTVFRRVRCVDAPVAVPAPPPPPVPPPPPMPPGTIPRGCACGIVS